MNNFKPTFAPPCICHGVGYTLRIQKMSQIDVVLSFTKLGLLLALLNRINITVVVD